MTAEGLAEVYNAAAFLGKTKGSDLLRYPVPVSAGDVLVLDESSHDLDRGPGPDHGLRRPRRGAGRAHRGRARSSARSRRAACSAR